MIELTIPFSDLKGAVNTKALQQAVEVAVAGAVIQVKRDEQIVQLFVPEEADYDLATKAITNARATDSDEAEEAKQKEETKDYRGDALIAFVKNLDARVAALEDGRVKKNG